MSTELETREKRVRTLLARMATLGAMRPGTLSVQYRDPAEKKTPFNQLSFTHKGKGRSDPSSTVSRLIPVGICAFPKQLVMSVFRNPKCVGNKLRRSCFSVVWA